MLHLPSQTSIPEHMEELDAGAAVPVSDHKPLDKQPVEARSHTCMYAYLYTCICVYVSMYIYIYMVSPPPPPPPSP